MQLIIEPAFESCLWRNPEESRMPIYEYMCTKCGEIHEVMQSFKEPPLETCSLCAGPLKKLISDCAFHLKGTGWYVTDYGDKNKKKGKEAEEKPEKTEKKEKKEKSDSGKDKAAKKTSD